MIPGTIAPADEAGGHWDALLVGIALTKLADIWRRLAEEGVLTEVGVLPAEAGWCSKQPKTDAARTGHT
jgi:hypothetical protein